MKLIHQEMKTYLEALASDAPAPGGGSASALCGAQGAALTAMVAGLTLGRKKYENEQTLCTVAVAQATSLKEKLEAQIDRDTEAYNLVCGAFKLPKDTQAQIQERSGQIAQATLAATQVPFETMALALEALRLTQSLVGHSNANAASDLGVAALNLLSCVKGAWLNVLINLSGVKDEGKAAAFFRDGGKMAADAEEIARGLYAAVAGSL